MKDNTLRDYERPTYKQKEFDKKRYSGKLSKKTIVKNYIRNIKLQFKAKSLT